MTAYKFQPTTNNPYLRLTQEEEYELAMNAMNENEAAVLDFTEHDYSTQEGTSLDENKNLNNSNVHSRKQQTI
jgi:hypothetical protein